MQPGDFEQIRQARVAVHQSEREYETVVDIARTRAKAEAARRRQDLDNVSAQIEIGRQQLELAGEQTSLARELLDRTEGQGAVTRHMLWVAVATLTVAVVVGVVTIAVTIALAR